MNEQDSVSEIDNPRSFLLSEEERNAIVLGCVSEEESLEDRNRWQGQSVTGNLENIVSYEDMILKSKNPPIGETLVEKAGINDNVGDREAVFLHQAGRRFSFLRTDGFQRKIYTFGTSDSHGKTNCKEFARIFEQ